MEALTVLSTGRLCGLCYCTAPGAEGADALPGSGRRLWPYSPCSLWLPGQDLAESAIEEAEGSRQMLQRMASEGGSGQVGLQQRALLHS